VSIPSAPLQAKHRSPYHAGLVIVIDVQTRPFRRGPTTDRTSPTLPRKHRLEVVERDPELPLEIGVAPKSTNLGTPLFAVRTHVLSVVLLPPLHVRLDLFRLLGVTSFRARCEACLAIAAQAVLASFGGVELVERFEFSAFRAAFHCSIIASPCDSYSAPSGALYINHSPPFCT
jgi:hypothetical protein